MTSSVDMAEVVGTEILTHAINHNFAAFNSETNAAAMQARIDAHRIMSDLDATLSSAALAETRRKWREFCESQRRNSR